MRRRRLPRVDGEELSINLTPLIDVVFVILIMFIVVAPLLEMDRVELASGAAGQKSVESTAPIAIYVRDDNSIWYQGERLHPDQLLHRLRMAKAAAPDAIPQLFHDKSALFGTYQTVKNVVESAGFAELDIILKPS